MSVRRRGGLARWCLGDLPTVFTEKLSISTSGCWLWTAHINPKGYGRFYFDGRNGAAHRFSYRSVVGPIPEGLELDHLCRVRHCVNPAHLEPVTSSENKRRSPLVGRTRPRTSHCINGHEREGNTYVTPKGEAHCRVCQKEGVRRYRARKAAAA